MILKKINSAEAIFNLTKVANTAPISTGTSLYSKNEPLINGWYLKTKRNRILILLHFYSFICEFIFFIKDKKYTKIKIHHGIGKSHVLILYIQLRQIFIHALFEMIQLSTFQFFEKIM